ncbi:MAG: endonuclease/exonuclease/phosphatase family protein [Xanthomonadales bacterium]|nr:endonuclease/exonuclease/phosphatase family protein [Xanthomonadales bacterium]
MWTAGLDSLARLSVLAAVAALLGYAGAWHWLLDLCAHFRWQYAVILPLGMVAALLRRKHGIGLLLLGVGWLNAWSLITATGPKPVTPIASDARSWKLLMVNVHVDNPDYAALLALIEQESPDVIGVLELSPRGAAALRPLDARYPVRHTEARDDPFGIGLWSRLPASLIESTPMPPIALPTLRLDWADPEPGSLWLVHPFPPIGGDATRWRDQQLAELATRVRGAASVIVTGDLNATPWSAAYRQFRADSGLADAAAGGWPWPTWSGPNVFAALAIPIDHALHGSGWQVRRHSVGPDVGSDHRPVIVEWARHPG